jgi:acyl carrier protein
MDIKSTDNLTDRVERYLNQKIADAGKKRGVYIDQSSIEPELNLYITGLFDSYDLFEFLADIQETFSIELDISDLHPNEFTRYDTLKGLILHAHSNM